MGEKKKKITWHQCVETIFQMLLGAALGVLIVKIMFSNSSQESSWWNEIGLFFFLSIVICIAFLLQIIIHEAGHLVFGRISGYAFSSFRVMGFMWIKENNKLKFKRLTIVGMGGQCLMAPPKMKDGHIPVFLYNMGGSLMNIFAGFAFWGISRFVAKQTFLSTALLVLAITGFVVALMNGVPMRYGTINNDGYNALTLRNNKEAMRAFWVQLSANEQMAKGIRLKDMPDEWFVVPSDDMLKNSMIAVIGVFACNRLMDQHKFEEASQLMSHLLHIDSGIVDLHRSLIVCDRLYCELIGENRQEIVEELLTKKQKEFMKTMKKFPAVLRTQYAYTLLAKRDESKTNKINEQFLKCAKTYPYPSDIQSEQELIEIAKESFTTGTM